MQAGGLYIPCDMALLPGPDEPNDSVKSSTSSSNAKPKSYYAPDYVFLIEHTPSSTTYMFDLGMRKDLENLPPLLVETVLPNFKCEPQSPADILAAHGTPAQQPERVQAVIFSHMHFDHVGDGAKAGFENAELWLGPTTCTYARPGYPVDARAPTLSETLPTDGSRKVMETYIPDEALRAAGDKRAGKVTAAMMKGLYNGTDLKRPEWMPLASFERAWDVWADGSAYLIDAPGHSAGHTAMLIRTTSSPDGDSFVLLAGDAFHHPAMLQEPRRTARPPFSKESMHSEPEVAIDTIWRTRKCAERDDVWVLGAHDFSVGEGIGLAEGEKVVQGLTQVNEWKKKGWKGNLV
jgi:glyoxylase-like metal-dependent hydrolase (beta-lactamase superfamily II)